MSGDKIIEGLEDALAGRGTVKVVVPADEFSRARARRDEQLHIIERAVGFDPNKYRPTEPMDETLDPNVETQMVHYRNPEDNWRPIETAPHDGTWVLLWIPNNLVSDWVVAFWDEEEPGWYDWEGAGSICHDPMNPPTHWMPLPGPPKP